jgi:hypothetical protein
MKCQESDCNGRKILLKQLKKLKKENHREMKYYIPLAEKK